MLGLDATVEVYSNSIGVCDLELTLEMKVSELACPFMVKVSKDISWCYWAIPQESLWNL